MGSARKNCHSIPGKFTNKIYRFAASVVVVWAVLLAAHYAHGQTYTVLHSFDYTDGSFPWGGVISGPSGTLYGTTFAGGATGYGTVFKLDASGNETILYSFAGGTDGGEPMTGVIRDAAGSFYGTTHPISNSQFGTVFELSRTEVKTILYNFMGNGLESGDPRGNLVRDADGNLYGTVGSPSTGQGFGMVYKLDTTGTETILHAFTGGADGSDPLSGVIRDSDGNLYGTTYAGGIPACSANAGCGVVFKIDPAGNETVLYTFTGDADGSYPYGGLIRDAAGNLYGTTSLGGASGTGTVFKLSPAGVKTILYNFGFPNDGAVPEGNLIRDSVGNLYGTTNSGGFHGWGTIFKVDRTGKETVLYRFKGKPNDGSNPIAGLIRDSAGNFYGTTLYGGGCSLTTGCGVVFKLAP
jgi:uncharacterized repeat protein (TIGR03803 family)